MVLTYRLVGNVATPHALLTSNSCRPEREIQPNWVLRLSPENNWSNFPFPILEQGSSQKSGVRSQKSHAVRNCQSQMVR